MFELASEIVLFLGFIGLINLKVYSYVYMLLSVKIV